MGATPLYLAIILARANAYLCVSATLRLNSTVVYMYSIEGYAPYINLLHKGVWHDNKLCNRELTLDCERCSMDKMLTLQT